MSMEPDIQGCVGVVVEGIQATLDTAGVSPLNKGEPKNVGGSFSDSDTSFLHRSRSWPHEKWYLENQVGV